MTKTQSYGIFAGLIGLFLLGFAIYALSAPIDQVSNGLTGRGSALAHTIWLFAMGYAAVAAAVLFGIFGRRTR